MNLLTIWISIMIAYWWMFKRETPQERKYRDEQQTKRMEWNKYNMNNQQTQQNESECDKHNTDQLK